MDVDYESLVADPEGESRRMLAFIGLPWDAACLAPERSGQPIRTASVWQARQPIYRTSTGRHHDYAAWVEGFAALAGAAADHQAIGVPA
jgi:hypothetical protein